ncbi:uncharacterized protein plekhs1.4 [Brachyhypopomus gauderio]|uniref:uncharacterized protein plekhs1.4 n=1 Tax=Brachyhypopomus gauderio TaxID=698409 RepID=UPI004041CBBA
MLSKVWGFPLSSECMNTSVLEKHLNSTITSQTSSDITIQAFHISSYHFLILVLRVVSSVGLLQQPSTYTQLSTVQQSCQMAKCDSIVVDTSGKWEELCAGYLYKSPPARHYKSQKSWKRRFFLLFKTSEATCWLKYFADEEMKRSEALGTIDLSQVSLMCLCPETHSMWKWIHANFRCSPSCVLFMKVVDREYFLIAESSCDTDRWFRALFDALNSRPHRLLEKEFGGIRDIGAPPCSLDTNQRVEWKHTEEESIYAWPRSTQRRQNMDKDHMDKYKVQ